MNWSTDATDSQGLYAYPQGTYVIFATSRLNGMNDNYKNAGADYTGKTVSQAVTVTLVSDTVKIEANKDSVIRSKPFSVTVTGKPRAIYHIWVKGTSTMSGAYDNQPPMITKLQLGVLQDVFVAPAAPLAWVAGTQDAGGYSYENGNGATVWSDVASGSWDANAVPPVDTKTALGNGTYVYANITLSTSGTRTVEFTTSNRTRAQKYTIRVEQQFPSGIYGTGTYKSDEVDVIVEKGAVTIAVAGDQTYDIGENIVFTGTNTNSYLTYLFIAGPGLPPEGAQLSSTNPKNNPVLNGVPSSFVQQTVMGDNTWGYTWHTDGISIDTGIYTIIAASDPVDALHLFDAASYASTSIVVKNVSVKNFIPLNSGWNFISTPKKLLDGNNTAKIFSNVDTMGHSIFFFNASEQRWYPMTAVDNVRPLDGIWIFSKNPAIVNILFDENPVQTPPSKILTGGWNAIGFSALEPAYARDTLVSVQPEWSTLIGFDAANQRYETAIINGGSGIYTDYRYMYPARGYWISMRDEGTLTAIGA